MKYAYKNGKILNGTKEMQVQTGLTILTEGENITAIVPEESTIRKVKRNPVVTAELDKFLVD